MTVSSDYSYDVVVVGGGTAGSAAACFLARSGLKTALVEERTFDSAGARWVDGIPSWMFTRAGLAPPEPPELLEVGGAVTVRNMCTEARVKLDPNPLLNVDMRLLVERLQRLAREAGVDLFERLAVKEVRCDDSGRPVAIIARGRENTSATFRARLFVDASGLAQVLLRRVPLLGEHCPPPTAGDICSAAQLVCKVACAEGAREFLAQAGIGPSGAVSWLGVESGYSTVGVHVTEDLDRVGLLAGIESAGRVESGQAMLDQFLADNDWIGEREFGGQGQIPLRAAYARLAAPGIALVGNSGCQVFPAHASGAGAGLIAARLLAESVAGRHDPGDEIGTWNYQRRYHAESGAVNAAYDMIRRMSQGLSRESIGLALESGFMSVGAIRSVLEQKMPELMLSEVLGVVRGFARQPRLGLAMFSWAALMPLVYIAYRSYPRHPDLHALRRWSHLVARLSRTVPDLP